MIAVNCSFRVVPFAAAYLFFGDTRFWYTYGEEIKANFPGTIVTAALENQSERINDQAVKTLIMIRPPGLAWLPDRIAMQWTSLSGAINLALHLGGSPLVLFGADGGIGTAGKTHHHADHPWPQRPGHWQTQYDELSGVARTLSTRGVDVFNASPGSRLDFWPVISHAQALSL